MPSLGERIKTRRQQLGWTQDRLASEAGISKGFLSDLERDERNVSAEYLQRIARALGVTLDFLVEGGTVKPLKREVKIPASLSNFAKSQNLTFTQTVSLLEFARQVVAHRSRSRSDDIENVDWKRFYEAVKKYLT
jgi:DNA-binding XRE family transcriptional regulator